MNKRFIITILLALVALTSRGQVKSGLDLCLRDEVTGEWLIGLFDDYAIYNCEYWDYVNVRKDKLELKCGEKRMNVVLKRKGQAVTTVSIDGVKCVGYMVRSLPWANGACTRPEEDDGGQASRLSLFLQQQSRGRMAHFHPTKSS